MVDGGADPVTWFLLWIDGRSGLIDSIAFVAPVSELVTWCRRAAAAVGGCAEVRPDGEDPLVACDITDLASLRRLLCGLDDLVAGAREAALPGWRDAQGLLDDLRLLAELAGATGSDRLRASDVEAVRHALKHVLDIAGGWSRSGAVPLLADLGCGCPAGRWLASPAVVDELVPPGPTRWSRVWSWARLWSVRAGIVLAGGVAAAMVVALGVEVFGTSWTVVLPGVIGGLSSGVMLARRHRPARDEPQLSTGVPARALRVGSARDEVGR